MSEFDEVGSRADGAEDVVVTSGKIVVDDGAQLGLFIRLTSLSFALNQFSLRLLRVEKKET